MSAGPLDEIRVRCDAATGVWPIVAPVLVFLVVATILALLVHLRRKIGAKAAQEGASGAHARSKSVKGRRKTCTLSFGAWLEMSSPLLCGLLVFSVFLGALTLSGFFGADLDGRAFLFLAEFPDAPNDMVAEQAARGLWGVATGTLLLAEAFALWTVAEAWIRCDKPEKWYVLGTAVGILVLIVVVVAFRTMAKMSATFGSNMVLDLVCFTSERSLLYRIGPFTDGLNMLGVLLPIAVSSAFCLTILASSTLSGNLATDLDLLGRCQHVLDKLLIAAAAVLVAGLAEVVTLVSWSFAPYAGSTELKQHTEICRAGSNAPSLQDTEFCKSIDAIVEHAERIDDARKFTRSLALTFGFCFSGLLVAFYSPAALHLQKQVGAALRSAPNDMGPEQLAEALSRAGVDRTPYKQAMTVGVSMTPVLAGVISAFLSQ